MSSPSTPSPASQQHAAVTPGDVAGMTPVRLVRFTPADLKLIVNLVSNDSDEHDPLASGIDALFSHHWKVFSWEDLMVFSSADVAAALVSGTNVPPELTAPVIIKKLGYIVDYAQFGTLSPTLTMNDIVSAVTTFKQRGSTGSGAASSPTRRAVQAYDKKAVPTLDKFSGHDEDYFTWKEATVNVLGTAGFGRFLDDPALSGQHPEIAESIFYALRGAVHGGQAQSIAQGMLDDKRLDPTALWNGLESYYDTALNRANVVLFDIRHSSSPPATYARGRTRLDYALSTAHVATALTKSGYEPFNERFHTDHRAYFMDFNTAQLFGTPTQKLGTHVRRILNSSNTSQVTHFNLLSFYTTFLSVNRFLAEKVLRLLVLITMTEGSVLTSLLAEHTLPPDDDPLFGFITKEWYDATSFEMKPPETDEEQYRRLADETVYRNSTSTTHWHKYAVLARHTVEGPWFDDILQAFPTDPSQLHHLVWFNFMYHVDRQIDIPELLQSWAMSISNPFLAVHYPESLKIDTITTPWKTFHGRINPWMKIGAHNKPTNPYKRKKTTIVSPPNENKPTQPINKPPPPTKPSTILEESDRPDVLEESTSEIQNPKASDTSSFSSKSLASSFDAKQSALVPNSSIPLNDGTHRVTFRIKMDLDVRQLDKKSAELSQSIYDFLVKIFQDDDGMLYNWHSDGLENPKVISQLSPSEVRAYLPSITMSPTQALIIIPVRFGFNYTNSTIWRNRTNTKNNLALHNATVSISNSKSTGGKNVIAGYILLKAPNLTHRVRYHQFLRSKLPEATPHFDLLLHRETPLDQRIDHLVIQCGERFVHSVSQALLNYLTGRNVGVYIPRFAFESMTQEAISALFQKHDAYVKSLKMIPLAPFITNIDTLRTEQFETGEKIDRSTREWASALTLPNSDTSTVKCDVVNGGFDQKAYLLISQIHYDFVISEFAAYKKRVFPFSKREEQFRASIGPPKVIHITDNKIRANLSIFDSLSVAASPTADNTNLTGNASQQHDQRSSHSSASKSSTSSVSASIDLHSHRQQNSINTPRRHSQTNTSTLPRDDLTSTTGASSHSWNATSISSTNQARFHELDAIIKRQRKDHEKLSKITDDRLSQMERQFHRLETIENAVTESKASQVEHNDRLQGLETQVVQFMEQQVDMGKNILSVEDKINSLISIVNNLAINSQHKEDTTSQETHKEKSGIHLDEFCQPSSILEIVDTDMASNPSTSSDESSSFQTTCSVPSPEKKKVRASPPSQQSLLDSAHPTPNPNQQEPTTQPLTNASVIQATSSQSSLNDVSANLEARYNYNALGGGHTE
ncbi:hypothetical protein MHU86_23702 [Fragilaria crotonensis]|nr:hypothetical protein MHU86_23702 [Fragilaria crotonensis]